MDGTWRLVSMGSAVEPLTTAEAKLQCRVDGTAEDDLLAAYIRAARHMCEEQTWRCLLTQTWDLWLPCWPPGRSIRLPRPPLRSVTYIKYYDAAGVQQTLSSDAYQVIAQVEPGGVALASGQYWPGHSSDVALPINIRFVAGYGDAAANVPEPLRQGMRLLVGHMYANRESVNVGNITNVMPQAVDWLWAPYMVRW